LHRPRFGAYRAENGTRSTHSTILIPRFPSMHLMVDPTTLTVRRDVLAGGFVELPVSW
jgi:hypothetical protein